MAMRVLVNPMDREVPESGPITLSMQSRYHMTDEQVRLYTEMAVLSLGFRPQEEEIVEQDDER